MSKGLLWHHAAFDLGFSGGSLVLYNGSVLAYLQAISFPDLLHGLATSD